MIFKKSVILFQSLLFLQLVPTNGYSQSFIISTVAGDSIQGTTGDGGQATAAEVSGVEGIVSDASGNIYFTNDNSIRMISSSGIISTIADSSDSTGYSGDGIQAITARLYYPTGLAIDKNGNLYVADVHNNRIRVINKAGIISTIAGNGIRGYSGDGGPASAAELNWPIGISIDDSNNIYIADSYNECVRKINNSGIISTIAGDGYVSFGGSGGYGGDGGPATAAELNLPDAVVKDHLGNIYIADRYNNCIRKVNAKGIISTFAGNTGNGYGGDGGPATAAYLADPSEIVLDALDNVYVSDANSRIRMINAHDTILTVAGDSLVGYNGDNILATKAELNLPVGITIDKIGNLYIADWQNYRVRKLTLITSINELSRETGINVYPNPSNGHFTLQMTGIYQKSEVVIYSMFGENIYSEQLNSTTTQVYLNNESAGVYLYRIISEKGEAVASGKLIIEQ